MDNVQVSEKPIVNIVKVVIDTETSGKRYVIKTADEATYSAVVSEGEETLLRKKNTIYATNKTEDIQYGCDITLKDGVFTPEVLCVVDGGTLKKEDSQNPNRVTGYAPPVVGGVVNRELFTMSIYTDEKDQAGESIGYGKFVFPKCKGKPASFNFKDGEFMAPEYTITSRPPKNTAPYDVQFLTPQEYLNEGKEVFTLTIGTAFVADETIKINDVTYTASADGTGENEFAVGSSANDQATSLASKITLTDFDVTHEDNKIIFTQKVAGVGTKPTITVSATTGQATIA